MIHNIYLKQEINSLKDNYCFICVLWVFFVVWSAKGLLWSNICEREREEVRMEKWIIHTWYVLSHVSSSRIENTKEICHLIKESLVGEAVGSEYQLFLVIC